VGSTRDEIEAQTIHEVEAKAVTAWRGVRPYLVHRCSRSTVQ